MMITKLIKTEEEYQNALEFVSALMDASPGSKEEEELELVAALIEKYEEEHFPVSLPDPVEAITFRMEQQGLTQRDLIPYIGSQSKVSEILNHKRPLSLSMIRNLHEGLEIPAEVLIQKPGATIPEKKYDLSDFPFTLLYNQGYFSGFSGSVQQAKQQAEECLEELFSVFKGNQQNIVLCRNSEGEVNKNYLLAWQARILSIANQQNVKTFNYRDFSIDHIEDIVHKSAFTTGPLKARDYLANIGISLVTLRHLPKTFLDGACFLSPEGRPIIGMTLRHDRLDNFWFTLIHELAHVYLHLGKADGSVFMDDTEQAHGEECDTRELEANQFTSDMLIPPDKWNKERDILLMTMNTSYISELAESMEICPAIIAGRIRHERKDYSLLSNFVGSGEVRGLFEGAKA